VVPGGTGRVGQWQHREDVPVGGPTGEQNPHTMILNGLHLGASATAITRENRGAALWAAPLLKSLALSANASITPRDRCSTAVGRQCVRSPRRCPSLGLLRGYQSLARRLWEVSGVLALREAAEAGDWSRMAVLSPGAVSWYLRNLERQLGPDRGLGDSQLRKELTGLLRSGLAPDSHDHRRLVQLMPVITDRYLGRWASAVDSDRCPSPERLSRALATYLLDCGHSSGQLHRWIRALSREQDATLADQQDQTFEVLVPFVSRCRITKLWLPIYPSGTTAERTAAWFAENKFEIRLVTMARSATGSSSRTRSLRQERPVARCSAWRLVVPIRVARRSAWSRSGRSG